jgi:hypothetical protein
MHIERVSQLQDAGQSRSGSSVQECLLSVQWRLVGTARLVELKRLEFMLFWVAPRLQIHRQSAAS